MYRFDRAVRFLLGEWSGYWLHLSLHVFLILSPSKHISIKLTFSHSSMSRHFLVFGAKNPRTRAQQLNWIGSYPFYPGWNEAWGFFFGATKPKSPVFRCSTGEYQRSVCPMPVPTCSNMFWPDSLHESRWRSRTSWHSHVNSSERQLSSWDESESDQELQLVYIGLLMHLDDMRGCNTRATFRPNSVLQALLARCPISRVSSLTKQERTVTIRDLMTTCSISGCRALQLEPGNPVTGAFTSSTRASAFCVLQQQSRDSFQCHYLVQVWNLTHFIWSHLMWAHLISFHLISSNLISFHFIWSNLFSFHLTSHLIQSHFI